MQTLLRKAIWHDGMCVWVTQVQDSSTFGRVYGTTNASLYDGTAGISLALANYARVTGEVPAIEAARGASKHALRNQHKLPASRGCFGGNLGVAASLREVGRLLDDNALASVASKQLVEIFRDPLAQNGVDYGDGVAGVLAMGAQAHLNGIVNIRREWFVNGVKQLLSRLTQERPKESGFVHGIAGIGLAICLAGVTIEHRVYVDQGRDLVMSAAKELAQGQSSTAGNPPIPPIWCSGAAGVLDCIVSLPESPLDAELVDVARRLGDLCKMQLSNRSERLLDDTVCHGAPGCAMVLARSSTVNGLEIVLPDRAKPLKLGSPPGGTCVGLFDGLAGLVLSGIVLDDGSVGRDLPQPFGFGLLGSAAGDDSFLETGVSFFDSFST